MGCSSCVQKARRRRIEFDRAIIEAKKQAIKTNEEKAVCKEGSKGKFFICSVDKARANKYTILEIISVMPEVSA
jgi:hypothetical protein